MTSLQAEPGPIDAIDVADFDLFRRNAQGPIFARLRREDPVHYCANSLFGPYWSITRFDDIVAIDTDHGNFSSEARLGGISVADVDPDFTMEMFIAMDPPRHADRRKAVTPAFSPAQLRDLEPLIRARAAAILDGLPVGEPLDWVSSVAVELTSQMLATLLGAPQEDRHKLIFWSNVTVIPAMVPTEAERRAELLRALAYFQDLWATRSRQEPRADLISLLAHHPSTSGMAPMELLGNAMLLVVGGNDTTRSSITGGILAFSRFPEEMEKLRADPSLVPSAVSEIIRWQTPLAHMRRTALRDLEFRGRRIARGDKVVMWYLSGNRDEAVFDRAEDLIIDRPNPRRHLSFGFGIHRCLGNRLAEMQLRVLWEEILARNLRIEVLEEPVRTFSSFVRGYDRLMTRVLPG